MNTRTLLIPCICAVLLFALVLPASADNSAPAIVQPTATVTMASPPSFDPFGSILGIFGLRQDIHTLQNTDRNLSQDIQANQQEIHQNWWDNLNIFSNIMNNWGVIHTDQQVNLANRTANLEDRQDIQMDRMDMKNDPVNRSVYQDEIATQHSDIRQDWQDINATHDQIQDVRDANHQNWAAMNQNWQQNQILRREDNATHQVIQQNHEQIQDDRQQIRSDREGSGSS
jgi:hypothetical protein